MSLIKKIIKDDNKSGSSNFDLMIAKESSIHVTFDEKGNSKLDTRKLFPFILNKMSKSVALITINYLGISAYSKDVLDSDNILTYQPNLRFKSSIFVKVISLSLDEKMNDGLESGTQVLRTASGSELLFGFVDESKHEARSYSTLSYHDDYIPDISESQGSMSIQDKKVKELSPLFHLGELSPIFHLGMILFMNNLWSNGNEVATFDNYSEKIREFKKEFGVDNKMLLYVKTVKNGKIHSENDHPAIIWMNGREDWYRDGKLHRDNAPAIILNSVNKLHVWYQHGRLHRIDGPAITFISSSRDEKNSKEFWINGKRHSEDDQLTYTTTYKHIYLRDTIKNSIWQKYGMKHHINGPATIYERINDHGGNMQTITSEKQWYQCDQRHRIGAPAVEIDTFDISTVSNFKTMIQRKREWIHKGKLDKVDEPAVIDELFNNGKISEINQVWYRDGKLHRVDGSAIVKEYFVDGNVELSPNRYYFRGNQVSNLNELRKLFESEQRQEISDI